MKVSPVFPVRAPSLRAFSLVESLAVVAIIGVLAALLMPMVGKMQKTQKATITVSRLKSLGNGVLTYAADNDGRLPLLCGASYKKPYWSEEITPYLAEPKINGGVGGAGTATWSPSLVDPQLKATQHHSLGDFGGNPEIFLRSYPSSYGAVEGRKLSSVPRPAGTAMAMTAVETLNPLKGSWYVEAWEYAQGKKNGLMPYDHGTGKIHLVFVDGHVASMTVADLDAKRKEILLADPNFHPPPINFGR
jgi:prepilin-type N-terminal cleavage/methylation domain-containing protein/prepilin-type processing-associated H-X9-DG protein